MSKKESQTNSMKDQSTIDQKSTTERKDSSLCLSEKRSQPTEIETHIADSKPPEMVANENKIPDAKLTSASILSSTTTASSSLTSTLISNMSSTTTTTSSLLPSIAEATV